MKTKTRLFLVMLCCASHGCSNTSGAIKTGPDSFTISASASPARGGLSAAKQLAYGDAGTQCAKLGLTFLAVDERVTMPTWTDGMTHVELNFRCVKP